MSTNIIPIDVDIPNTGLGDVLRDAYIICNTNFNALNMYKADLVNGKIPVNQIPNITTTTISFSPPTGIPANGDVWIQWID
jgi:hypothetical protein